MITFEWPWLALLAPLPILLRYLLPPLPSGQNRALLVPFFNDFEQPDTEQGPLNNRRYRLILALLGWLLLVLAAMRPQWLGEPLEIPLSGRDLMLAIDLSNSMSEEDFLLNGQQRNRLAATKSVAGRFIERRVGDRIGLILFGEQAYLQAPLTLDRQTVKRLLDEASIGMAGKSTAIGDAIALAVKRLRERDNSNRLLILLTDGKNTAGVIDPQTATALAEKEGMRIYTIGIGSEKRIVQTPFGSQTIRTTNQLDESSLRDIAKRSGGRYFRARDSDTLEEIYALIDRLEPVTREQQIFRPRRALFHWPLTVALLLVLALLLPAPRWPLSR